MHQLSAPAFALVLALLPCRDARAQGDGPGRPAPDQETVMEAVLGDGVVAVVGRALIRRSDMLAALETPAFRERVPGLDELWASQKPADRDRAVQLALVELLREHLKTEGGRNQGYSPEMVQAILERRMAELQADLGGAVGTTEALRSAGYDPQSYNERTETLLLRQTWEASVTGRAAGPTGRVNTDRYVPPGLLWLERENRLRSRRVEDQLSVGRTSERWVLEQVILGLRDYGGMTKAAEIADAVRAEVAAGRITMEAAARRFTLPQQFVANWRIEPMTAQQLPAYSRRSYGDDRLADWATTARPGDTSEPFVFQSPSEDGSLRPSALVVYRLAELLPASDGTPFPDAALQDLLREEIRKAWDDLRVERGLYDLLRATYVWPPRLKEQILRRAGGADQTPAPGAP